MGIRLIAGRAGSGKTYWCQSQICEELHRSLIEGPRLVMLVPEQAGLLMERSLLAMAEAQALGRCEVLSFRRLSHRILNESIGPAPTPLTPIGRQMALRYLINRRHDRLQEFGKVAQRGGFIADLSRGIAELMQEAVTLDQLDECARAATESSDPTAARLHDLALLYRAYLEFLGSKRVDPEGVLDLARARLSSATWLHGARIWIDGFAGLTQQQLRMCIALAQIGSHVDIALLVDPERGRAKDLDAPEDDLSLFARTEHTWWTLARSAREAGVEIESPIKLDGRKESRFKNTPLLADLEKRLFTAAWVSDDVQINRTSDQGVTGSIAAQSVATSNQTVRFVQAPHRRAEVDATVRTIVDLVQSPERPMRYRDIAIIVRDLAPYHDLISASLRAHDIPFFIDRRRPTYHHPLVQLVRAALSMYNAGSFDQAMSLFLKTGLAGIADEEADALENYILAHGITRADDWEQAWTLPIHSDRDEEMPLSPFEEQMLARVNNAREAVRHKIGAWWPTANIQHGRPACRTWVERLYAFLERLNLASQLARWCDDADARGDLDEAEEHQQVWADLVKLLDELVAALGEERMTGRQFRDVLESGLAEFTVGLVPPTLDQVLVSSIERSRHPAIRATFILGFNEGQFPSRIAEETILGDRERAFLAERELPLSRSRVQRLLDERMLAYVAVTRPSEMLWISHVASDEIGRPMPPSPYWGAIRAALPTLTMESIGDESDTLSVSTPNQLAGGLSTNLRSWCEEKLSNERAAAWLALYEWSRTAATNIQPRVTYALSALSARPEAKLSEAAMTALWRSPYATSVTRLETFASCPFKHYAAHGLRLEPRSRHEVSAIEMGRLYHVLLEQFVNHLIESGEALDKMTPADIADRLAGLCDQAIPEFAKKLNLNADQRGRLTWRSRNDLPKALRGHRSTIAKSPLRPKATEKHFGNQSDDSLPALTLTTSRGDTVLVRGKIDRLDLLETGDVTLAVVYDYKRSLGRRLHLDEVFHGLALQLLAYLLVVRDHYSAKDGIRIVPGGAFYLPVVGNYERVDHPKEADEADFQAFDAFKPRGVFDFDFINHLDPALITGRSEIFSAYRTKDGKLGYADSSDAVTEGTLPALLEHVRSKMAELAERWIGGDITVSPARLGAALPCANCLYRAVCRFEITSGQARNLTPMSRGQVLEQIAQQSGGTDE